MMIRDLIKKLMPVAIPRRFIIWSNPGYRNTVSISFDDGPHPIHTPRVLDVLQKHNVKATFFVLGVHVKKYPDVIIRLLNEGHEIGNHSFTHNGYFKGVLNSPEKELSLTNKLILDMFGYTIQLYRPPYGILSIRSLLFCLRNRMTVAKWSIDSSDYMKKASIINIVSSCLCKRRYDGDIMLFHDHNDATPLALDELIPFLKSQGVGFCKISHLV